VLPRLRKVMEGDEEKKYRKQRGKRDRGTGSRGFRGELLEESRGGENKKRAGVGLGRGQCSANFTAMQLGIRTRAQDKETRTEKGRVERQRLKSK